MFPWPRLRSSAGGTSRRFRPCRTPSRKTTGPAMQPNSIGSGNPADYILERGIALYPKVGEVFELALDGDAPENQPLEMVDSFGYNPAGWSHKGPKVSGRQTRRFKFVQVGYCSNVDKIKEQSSAHGEIPEGQWINAFKAAYP